MEVENGTVVGIETALGSLMDDLLTTDRGQTSIFLILDTSEALNAVDHIRYGSLS